MLFSMLSGCSGSKSNSYYSDHTYSDDYYNDSEYRKNVGDIADAYGESEEEVDKKIHAFADAMDD